MQRIDNVEDLEKTWEMWAEYQNVDALYFFSHGDEDGPEVHLGSGDFWSSPKELNFNKYQSLRLINGQAVITSPEAVFCGCNTAS